MPLPEGTAPVAVALLVAGLASFAFFRVGTMALGSEEAFKPVVSMWFATFALAPGVFLPLEQELGRAISARRALGQGGRPVLMKVLALGGGLAAIVTITLIAVGPWLADDYFGGNWVMVAALIVVDRGLRPHPHLPRHLQRIRPGSGPTPSSWAPTALVRIIAVPGARRDRRRRRRLVRHGRRGGAADRRRRRGLAGPAAHRSGPAGHLAGGHAQPGLAAARLGDGRRPGERRPDRHQHAGVDERGGPASPASATASSSPASRCSCSRPCRPRCSPACRGWPRRAR